MIASRARWLAAAAWGGAALVAVFAMPLAGIAMVVAALVVAGGEMVLRRRLAVLSGALTGFGGLFVGLWAIRATSCAGAVECEAARADATLVAGALAVLGAGVGLALVERQRGRRPPSISG